MAGYYFSKRARLTPPSPIRSLSPLAQQARSSGVKLYGLNIGQPDVESPAAFLDGLRLYQDNPVCYEDSLGSFGLRKAWSDFLRQVPGLELAPEKILITMGASEALIFSFWICCDPGDEIIVFDPSYANYMGFAAITGVELVPVSCSAENHFAIPDLSTIAASITAQTRAILVCSPNNPTGTVCTREDFARLLDIAEQRNIYLVVDETYRELVFDGRDPLSVLQVSGEHPLVIVVDSLSKRFSLCGARIGAVYTHNEELEQKLVNIAQARLSAPSVEQFASAHMLKTLEQDFITRMREKFENRRDTMHTALSRIEGARNFKPDGAFYSILDLPVDNAEEFARYLLKEFRDNNESVFLAPAEGFYLLKGRGRSQLRVANVLEEDKLERAATIIEKGLRAYRNRK